MAQRVIVLYVLDTVNYNGQFQFVTVITYIDRFKIDKI